MLTRLPALTDFRRIVVKVGSSLLVDSAAGRLRSEWLGALCEDISWLHKDKRDILVVSSGSIALGRSVLKLPKGPLALEDSQAAAAVGQIALARVWAQRRVGEAAHGAARGFLFIGEGERDHAWAPSRRVAARRTRDGRGGGGDGELPLGWRLIWWK